MKMYSKMARLPVKVRSAYEGTPLDNAVATVGDELEALIRPWKQCFSKDKERYFFHNPNTGESVWELPSELSKKADRFFECAAQKAALRAGKNFESFINPERVEEAWTFKQDWALRPAPIQKELALIQEHAYKESDREMNIWYDKTIQDEIVQLQEAARTRCDPLRDCGYTFADRNRRLNTAFCVHFAHGNCYKGESCYFYHHIPSAEECLKVENARDVFGRPRFAAHRRDKMGIGSFAEDTRTIRASGFALKAASKNDVSAMYEALWRHFGVWGTLEEMLVIPSANTAYLRYEHRCMAEFAKEAMQGQSLDAGDVLAVGWCPLDDVSLDRAEHQEVEEAVRAALPRKRKRRTIADIEREQEELLGSHFLRKAQSDPSRVSLEADYNALQLSWLAENASRERLQRIFEKRENILAKTEVSN